MLVQHQEGRPEYLDEERHNSIIKFMHENDPNEEDGLRDLIRLKARESKRRKIGEGSQVTRKAISSRSVVRYSEMLRRIRECGVNEEENSAVSEEEVYNSVIV